MPVRRSRCSRSICSIVKRGSSLNSDILLLDKRQDRQDVRQRRVKGVWKKNRKHGGKLEKAGKWMFKIWEEKGERNVEQEEQGGKSSKDDTEENERIK